MCEFFLLLLSVSSKFMLAIEALTMKNMSLEYIRVLVAFVGGLRR